MLFGLLLLSVYLLLVGHAVESRPLAKPPRSDKVRSARWLMSSVDWGVLGTTRQDGQVFTNVVSVSDGINSQIDRSNSTGIPFFFLTELDETAQHLQHHPLASFTVSEKTSDADDRCGSLDAQEPPCAKLTLRGKVRRIRSARKQEFARQALFSKHPAMEKWQKGKARLSTLALQY